MFTDDFNPATALAAASCPRCHAVGLVEIDCEAHDNTPTEHQYREGPTICPSVYARCAACGLVGEWPGMCHA